MSFDNNNNECFEFVNWVIEWCENDWNIVMAFKTITITKMSRLMNDFKTSIYHEHAIHKLILI